MSSPHGVKVFCFLSSRNSSSKHQEPWTETIHFFDKSHFPQKNRKTTYVTRPALFLQKTPQTKLNCQKKHHPFSAIILASWESNCDDAIELVRTPPGNVTKPTKIQGKRTRHQTLKMSLDPMFRWHGRLSCQSQPGQAPMYVSTMDVCIHELTLHVKNNHRKGCPFLILRYTHTHHIWYWKEKMWKKVVWKTCKYTSWPLF